MCRYNLKVSLKIVTFAIKNKIKLLFSNLKLIRRRGIRCAVKSKNLVIKNFVIEFGQIWNYFFYNDQEQIKFKYEATVVTTTIVKKLPHINIIISAAKKGNNLDNIRF